LHESIRKVEMRGLRHTGIIWLLFVSGTLHAEDVFSSKQYGAGELRIINSIPVVILRGTPTELGEQHAALLADESRALLEFPRLALDELGVGFAMPVVAAAGRTLLKNAPVDYRTEHAALAHKAKLDPDALAVVTTLLELRRLGCSVLIVEPSRSATGTPLFGRNFDFVPLGLLDRYGVVKIVHPAGKHAFAEVGWPGLIGVVSGMNDTGLCVATLDVYDSADESPHYEPKGVPMMLTFRRILEECATVAEAEKLLHQTQATTQANLAVCDRERGAVFEITPKQVAHRDAEAGLLPCTNHFRTENLGWSHRCRRYTILSQAQEKPRLDVADLQRYLHRANQGETTLQTMVFQPREMVLHLSLGNPPSSGNPLHRLELRELLQPGANKSRKQKSP
jgi:hypothetical protein